MPSRPYELFFESRLAAPAAEVARHAFSMQGVNRELFPILRMSYPRDRAALGDGPVPLGVPLFESWVRLFGIVPIDRSRLTLVEVVPGRSFVERSPMWTQREWQHEREVAPAAFGCVLTDRLRFTPLFGGLLAAALVRRLFEHRHRRLRRIFGSAAAQQSGAGRI